MPLEMTAKCDVYGTYKDVKRYRVTVELLDTETGEPKARLIQEERYMCRRAYDRAWRFIADALNKPSKDKPASQPAPTK